MDKGIDHSKDEGATVSSTPNPPESTIQYPPKLGPLGSVPDTKFICPICGKVFTTQNMLSVHRGIAHKPTKEPNHEHSRVPAS